MSFNNLDALYRQVIMDHYKNPRNKGSLEDGSFTVDMNNPTCGDRIQLTMKSRTGKWPMLSLTERAVLFQWHLLR